jgi:hypothetical protein
MRGQKLNGNNFFNQLYIFLLLFLNISQFFLIYFLNNNFESRLDKLNNNFESRLKNLQTIESKNTSETLESLKSFKIDLLYSNLNQKIELLQNEISKTLSNNNKTSTIFSYVEPSTLLYIIGAGILIVGGYFAYVSIVNKLAAIFSLSTYNIDKSIISNVKNIVPDQTEIKDIVVNKVDELVNITSNTAETIIDTVQNLNTSTGAVLNSTMNTSIEFCAATATNSAIAQSGLESRSRGLEIYQTSLNNANAELPLQEMSETLDILNAMDATLNIVKDLT